MSIGTTIASPSPARTAFAPSRGSPLNPAFSRHASNTNNSHSLRPSNNTNRSHLSNLTRFLEKQSPPPPPPPPHPSLEDSTNNDAADAVGNKTSNTIRHSGNLFNALNLNTIIPSLRNPATEAMSPKSLTQLQHLLNSPRPSPKNPISADWRRLHGSDNWANLLDPLDENLRRELCRYGDLVQAAYHAFHSNPAISSSQNRHVILPDRSYRVTKSLYATASVELPHWLDGVAPWMTQRSSWIGYVAVCDNSQEIHRMGRRDIVISLRGTSTCMEWAENFQAGLIPMEKNNSSEENVDGVEPKVATGFYSLYKTAGEHHRSLSETVVAEISRLTKLYKGEQLSITVTGHSLGAALALFVADEISRTLPNVPPVAVFSFGGPKVGDRAFADRLVKNGVKVLRVVNANDVITRVPGVLPTDGYVHAGTELRVDSKASPYLKPDADPACCHDLESYLHLVDGFMGSDCPFRADAKRSLVRLLDQQRPNMKRLYVSQATALRLDRFEPASPSHVTAGCLASPSAY